MSRRSPVVRIVACVLVALAAGCTPQQPFYMFEDGDLSHYRGMATDLEDPNLDQDTMDEVRNAPAPVTLSNAKYKEIWELSLEEAVKIALANSKIIRTINTSVFSDTLAPESMTRSADVVPSIWDPALMESNPRFGPEAALSAFDAQVSTKVFWEKNDRFQNSSLYPVLNQDLGTFEAGLSKYNATGGQTSLSYGAAYSASDTLTYGRLLQSDWDVNLTARFTQPLLQGAGVQFNRIAGPGAVPGFYNGVMIARINVDVALADFEAQVRNMVSDIERAYWDLYLAYRELDAVTAGRDSALETWRRTYTLFKQGGIGGDLANVAQALEQYYLFRAQLEDRKSEVFAAESQLRYMLGLAPTDGRLIRPAEEPTTAKLAFDWYESKCEALARNVDLRRQKWQVKKAELDLIASKNFLLPRLDLTGMYRYRSLGDHLWDANDQGRTYYGGGYLYDNAMGGLVSGDNQEWSTGINLEFPFGFRKEMAGVRNAQMEIARAKTLLSNQELEVTHQLAFAIRNLDKGVVLTRTNYNRVIAARQQLKAVQTSFDNGNITLNVVLDAQRRLAEAEIQYYRSLVQYNLAIAEVHLRKGSLLEYNGVYLAEGPWPGKAYFDARGRARARDAALFVDYGFTQPKVVSRGPYEQHAGRAPFEADGVRTLEPEAVPTPAPLEPTPEPNVSKALMNRGKVNRGKSAEWSDLFNNGVAQAKSSATPSAKSTAANTAKTSRPTPAGRLADRLRGTGQDDPGVRLVSYEAAGSKADAWKSRATDRSSAENTSAGNTSAGNTSAADGWRSIKRESGPASESFENPTPAETAGPASGWKGL